MNIRNLLVSTPIATALLFSLVGISTTANATPLDSESWIQKLETQHEKYVSKKGKAVRIDAQIIGEKELTDLILIQNKNGSSRTTANINGENFYQQRCTKPTLCWSRSIFTGKKWIKTDPSDNSSAPLDVENLYSFLPQGFDAKEKGTDFDYNEKTNTFSYNATDDNGSPALITITYDDNFFTLAALQETQEGTELRTSYTMNIDAKPVKVVKPKKNMIAKNFPR